MPMHKAKRYALFVAKMGIALYSYLGFLPASAMAVTIGYFACGFVRGMIVHVISSFQLVTIAGDARNVARFFVS